jgi:hypothetical protein
VTPSRWRAWRAWWIERDVQRQQAALRRPGWLADRHARLDAGQAAAGAELERWQRDLVPGLPARLGAGLPPDPQRGAAPGPSPRSAGPVAEAARQWRRRSVLGRRPRSRR